MVFLGALVPHIVTLLVTMTQNVFLDFKGFPFLPLYALLFTTIPYLLSYGLMTAIFYGKPESTVAFSTTAPTVRRRSIVYILLMIFSAILIIWSLVNSVNMSLMYPSGFLVEFVLSTNWILISSSVVLFWIAWRKYKR